MKKVILLLAAIAVMIATLGLQNVKAQSITKGDFIISFESGYFTVYSFDNSYASSGAPIGLSVGYALSDKIVVGAEVGFFNLTTTTTEQPALIVQGGSSSGGDTTLSGAYIYHFALKASYYMANIEYHWHNGESVTWYSGLGVGHVGGNVSLVYDLQDPPYSTGDVPSVSFGGFTYQLTAIGYKVYLTKHIGLHLAAGYGVKGILYGGVDFKL